jgi:antitoxin (DNA-binding transcriptional repressor) of toxin-antitoxin stability system
MHRSNSCQVDTIVPASYRPAMPAEKTMTVGEFKAQFSAALDEVRLGKTIVVAYGRNRRKVAAMVPYAALRAPQRRKLGPLEGKVTLRITADFALTDEGFLSA